MGEAAPVAGDEKNELHDRHRRAYQTLIVVAVLFAVIGSPLFMRGFAEFVDAMTSGRLSSSTSALRTLAQLAISASPLAIAGLTWRRARALERILEEEDLEKYVHHH